MSTQYKLGDSITGSGALGSLANILTQGSDARPLSAVSGRSTLAANATSTTITIAQALSTSLFFLFPTTQDAANFLYTVYRPVSGRANGSVALNHASNPNTDLTFDWLLII